MIDALTSGLLAGYGIAIPVGAIGVLVVTLSARVSLRHGAAAGLGVATADGLYALAAVVGGAAIARLLSPAVGVLQAAAAVVLAAIAVRGIVVAVRARRAPADTARSAPTGTLTRTYAAFVGLTLLNPMTIVYFAALVVGYQGDAMGASSSPALVGAVFVGAAFVASASWQLLLASGGAILGRTLASPRGRLITALVGNGIIALLAIRLAWQAVS
ncbi:LysE family transporter [Micromonospora sp. NBC_01813]|uniref:LysE family transporter n=1 Tax=Micromonospora sp. NBC_01813 TaxID=2975988 RepID=UPI002DDBADA8|nr:LysE family transporter [Micromonospora sp. NBC_01813]WSA08673.1 LysE family transporter [Micromonospora sp. NBC_01813]